MLEERPPRSKVTTTLLIVLLIGVPAVALRLVGLRWALPTPLHYFSYHPDEVFLLLPAVRYFARGDWNPHFFNYGTLYLYLVGIPAVLLGIARDPSSLAPLYLLGRSITALLGIASVPLLYLAVKGESKRLAAISAMLLAVLPLHVINSHYATVDVAATFWLVLAFLLTLRGARRPGVPTGLITGLAVGLAAATKYNAGLFLLPAILAPAISPPRNWRWTWLVAVVLGAALGFAVGCPYFTSPDFARGLRFELEHMRVGGTYAFANTGSGWGYHLTHGLPIALGFPLLLALFSGAYATFRLPSRAARVSLLWVVLYLLVIGFSKERFIRYLVPITPFLAVIAAAGLLWLWRIPRARLVRAVGAAFGAAVLILTGLYSWGQVRGFVGEDPRNAAWSSAGVQVVQSRGRIRAGLVQPPWYFSPPVSPYNAGPFSDDRFQKLNARAGHPIVITGWESEKLQAERPDFFFLSDLEAVDLLRLRNPEATRFVTTLEELYEERTVFARPPAPYAWLAPGRGWAPPDWLYPSPEITRYVRPRSYYAQFPS